MSGIKLWVSADRRRIPIRIESRVAVGRFVGELVSDAGRARNSRGGQGNPQTLGARRGALRGGRACTFQAAVVCRRRSIYTITAVWSPERPMK